MDDGIVVAGLPVLVSDQVDEDTVFWGTRKQHVMFVQRKRTTVERFPAVVQDGTYIRTVPGSAWPSSTRPAWFAATTSPVLSSTRRSRPVRTRPGPLARYDQPVALPQPRGFAMTVLHATDRHRHGSGKSD